MHHVLFALLTAGLSAFGAWVGGILGVRREADKLARSRAFDRRLDWYERTLKTLLEYKERTLKLGKAMLQDDPEAKRLRAEYLDFIARANDVLNEGALYGRPSTLGAIREMRTQFEIIAAKAAGRPNLNAAETAITAAWAKLVKEARNHLRLEKLPPDQLGPAENT